VAACPVKATWRDEDGIIVIDYDWCIGCRYCDVACPYWARRFNFRTPALKKDDLQKNMDVQSNYPRQKGVIEKCTFCLHRVRTGLYPACLEACPTGARKFGDLSDPDSEISYILKNKRVFVLRAELNTRPRFYYYFG
jgi:molybdopterin-containing oxidoreductase family iron-sulfur binding subunit